jgi:hypothetical protein
MSAAEQERAAIVRGPGELDDEAAFLSLYGPWEPLPPDRIAAELRGFARPWWIVGGWAIEAATGFRREHDDTDISILARDVPAFLAATTGRWHVWNNVSGVLRPLRVADTVDEPGSQLWLRRDARSPWVLDVPLTPDADGLWTNKVLPGDRREVGDATWVAADGLRYLLPEIVLAYKARLRRPKDDPDFDATLPTLSVERRDWLRGALRTVAPDHPWIARLDAS